MQSEILPDEMFWGVVDRAGRRYFALFEEAAAMDRIMAQGLLSRESAYRYLGINYAEELDALHRDRG